MGLRRWHARWLRRRREHEWPIKSGSQRRPDGWPGWPGDKKFALVLTHDVEDQKGLDRCWLLHELDRDMGFRSAFYFVPEGAYRAPDLLREDLRAEGCEVGVHDLHHDGKLYRSLASFKAQADRINHYLDKWNANGFRSGFMHHNLDWLHELNLDYDGSTFDTDPFEPQPDGVNTIFPFWVPKAGLDSDAGYVELPYTLPQDSTLFIVLQEPSIEIWQRKVNWIAEHGGMVLLNTHPDYMSFGPGPAGRDEYPVERYGQFLDWIRSVHKGAYWSALPSEVARLCAKARTSFPDVSCVRSGH